MNLPRCRLFLALMGGPFLATAAPAQAGLAPPITVAPRFTAPAPAMVVAPMNLPPGYRNATVYLRLTIDEHGRVQRVRLLGKQSGALRRHLLPVVAQWQFKPALLDCRPVPADVVLPLELVESPDEG